MTKISPAIGCKKRTASALEPSETGHASLRPGFCQGQTIQLWSLTSAAENPGCYSDRPCAACRPAEITAPSFRLGIIQAGSRASCAERHRLPFTASSPSHGMTQQAYPAVLINPPRKAACQRLQYRPVEISLDSAIRSTCRRSVAQAYGRRCGSPILSPGQVLFLTHKNSATVLNNQANAHPADKTSGTKMRSGALHPPP